MFDLLIGLGLAFFMLRIADRLSRQRPVPVLVPVVRNTGAPGRRHMRVNTSTPSAVVVRGVRDWVHPGFGRAASPQNQPHHRITRTVVPQHLSALLGKVQHSLERLRRVS